MYCNNSSPTISNCHFTDNQATYGGALAILNGSSPVITDALFTNNSAINRGGAISGGGNNDMTCTHSRFVENQSGTSGGAIDMSNSNSVIIAHCEFIQNSVLSGSSGGGAIYGSDVTSATVTNCLFNGNMAPAVGGAILQVSSSFIVRNTTFSHNSPNVIARIGGNLFVYNSILWDSGASEFYDVGGGSSEVYFSNIEGGWGGAGSDNINADPLFADPNGLDGLGGNEDDDLRLLPGSPCIDAADYDAYAAATSAPTDLGGAQRLVDDCTTTDTGAGAFTYLDMGAYEYVLNADLNSDGQVDMIDFNLLANDFNCTTNCTADINGDGKTDMIDLSILCSVWLCGAGI